MAKQSVLKFWNDKWIECDTPWHRNTVNESLLKYKDLLINGRSDIKIFFPFCGKSVDMKFLHDQGCRIVGADCCEKAVEDFFTENELKFRVLTLKDNIIVYVSENERIKIFVCDLLKFKKEYAGLMDAVWDRGALVAVEKEDRIKYVKTVMSVMAPGFRYLLVTYDYKDWFYTGCPRSVPGELVHLLYKSTCNVSELQVQSFKDCPLNDFVKAEEIKTIVWLITDANERC